MKKDHFDIFNLQALKYNHHFDFQDRRLCFKNTSIIMTSNVGSTTSANSGSKIIGFTFGEEAHEGRKFTLKKISNGRIEGLFSRHW